MTGDDLGLPTWAIVSPGRRAHIARVTELVTAWADAMQFDRAERDAWRDAARWHDALRDASDAELRLIVPTLDWPTRVLHGPAAATLLRADGEHRSSVLDAIYWHTIGTTRWDRTGRSLYMADYLDPERTFDRDWRADLAARVPTDFDGAFRDVVRRRLSARAASGEHMLPETAALWESVQ